MAMFTLLVVGALLVGTLKRYVSASSSPDALLDRYTKQLAHLNATVVSGIRCYEQYVPRIQKEGLPAKDVLESISSCDDLYDKAAKQLRDSRNTVNKVDFRPEKLIEKKLPNVANYRDFNTQGLQKTLEQLRQASVDAYAAYGVKKAAEQAVAKELAKPLKEQIVVLSKAAIKLETGIDGNIFYAVTGVIIAGILIAGTITYAPFTEAAVAVGNAVEVVETAIELIAHEVERIQAVGLDNMTIGQLRKMSELADEAHDAVDEAFEKLHGLAQQTARVPPAEMPEAAAIYHANDMDITALDARLTPVSQAVDAFKEAVLRQLL